MPTADLNDLAERLGMLQDCGCSGECERCGGGRGYRLPTEAEVRAALFASGRAVVVHADPFGVVVRTNLPGGIGRTSNAAASECASNDLVLLALLRALEAARA